MRTDEIREFRALVRRLSRQAGSLLLDRECCAGLSVARSHVLLELEDLGGATLNALARALRLDKSTASRTVDALVAEGLIVRAESAADRRCLVLTLSSAGRTKVAEIHASGDRNAREILKLVPGTRRKDVVVCLGLLVNAGDWVEGECCPAKPRSRRGSRLPARHRPRRSQERRSGAGTAPDKRPKRKEPPS